MFRPLTAPQLAFDSSIAAVCVLFRLAIGADSLTFGAAIVVFGVALAMHRWSPPLALGLAWGGAVLQMYAGATPDLANLAILVVLYSTARHGEGSVRWFGLGSAGLGAAVAGLYLFLRRPGVVDAVDYWDYAINLITPGNIVAIAATTIGIFAVLGLSWTIGLLVRTWARARDTRRAQLAAEQTIAVEQERTRIARDMHDVVAHSLAVVIAQADGARYAGGVAAKDEALATISGTAREALADVRLLLGQLRHRQEPGPQPVLDDLDRLVGQLRDSGLDVRVEQHGDAAQLPVGQQLAVYRIAQEALTNALRHGDRSQPVTLLLDWRTDRLEVTVTSALGDAGPGADGHGLPGMRERAILVGGSLDAGPQGGTWVVRARIPVGAA